MIKKLRFASVFILLVSLFTLISCAKISGSTKAVGEDELPDMIMHGATYTFGDKDRHPLIMKAETITIYSGKNGRTLLDGLTFSQEDDMEGSCDSAYISEDNTIAQMSGNVKLTKKTDNFSIECDSLEWNDEKQIIKTESEVHVVYEDGTELYAIGFSAQLDDNVYEFGQITEGRFVNED